MAQLHQITAEMRELAQLAEDPEMEIAVKDTLEGMQMTFNEKAEHLAKILLNMDGNMEAVNAEIERLQARKKRFQTQYASLIDYLRTNMDASGVKKISCPLFTITCAQGREKVVVDSVDDVPDDYMRIPEVVAEVDKVKALNDMKEGKEIPGLHLERGQSSIRIK